MAHQDWLTGLSFDGGQSFIVGPTANKEPCQLTYNPCGKGYAAASITTDCQGAIYERTNRIHD